MSRWLMRVGVALLVALIPGCGGGGTAGGGGTTGGTQTFVVWRAAPDQKPPVLAFKTPAKLAKGASVTDPVFSTRITRVTDRAVDGYAATGITNEYARVDPMAAAVREDLAGIADEVAGQVEDVRRAAGLGAGDVAPAGVWDALVKSEEDTSTLALVDQTDQEFCAATGNTSGKLHTITDPNSNIVTRAHNGSGRLSFWVSLAQDLPEPLRLRSSVAIPGRAGLLSSWTHGTVPSRRLKPTSPALQRPPTTP